MSLPVPNFREAGTVACGAFTSVVKTKLKEDMPCQSDEEVVG